jgi:hypothetical protein
MGVRISWHKQVLESMYRYVMNKGIKLNHVIFAQDAFIFQGHYCDSLQRSSMNYGMFLADLMID